MLLRKVYSPLVQSCRGALKPRSNISYGGIYRKDGELVRQGDLLVAQRKLNYHPGRNVSCTFDRGQLLLTADCDGTVLITRELVDLDLEQEFVQRDYRHRATQDLHKFHFHVLQRPMSQRFRLVEE